MKFFNKKAKFDYQILEKFEAGVALNGAEARAVREKHVNLSNSYAKIIGNEAFLINAHILTPRTRKLLLHKKEITSILTQIKAKKLTLVPLSLYTTHGLVKVELGLGKSKRKFEKRELIKKRDLERDLKGTIGFDGKHF